MDSEIISLIDNTPSFFIPKPKLSIPISCNPHHSEVAEEAARWIREYVNPKSVEKEELIMKWKLEYIAAYAHPTAPPHRLLALTKIYGWLCAIDDILDILELSADAKAFREAIVKILNCTYDIATDRLDNQELQNKIKMFDALWIEMIQEMTPHTKNAISRILIEALMGYRVENGLKHHNSLPSIETYVKCRRITILVKPSLAFEGYAVEVDIHWDTLFQHPEFEKLFHVATDHVLLFNDVISFNREWSQACDWNILTVLMYHHKCSLQDAVHHVFRMMEGLEVEFKELSKRIKENGELTRLGAAEAVNVAGNFMAANYEWSWLTGRYQGSDWKPPTQEEGCILQLKQFGSKFHSLQML